VGAPGAGSMVKHFTGSANPSGADGVSFPPGLHHAYLFSVFNAFSYQIVLNSPMVLYAKTLGASATVLGIIAGMMPCWSSSKSPRPATFHAWASSALSMRAGAPG